MRKINLIELESHSLELLGLDSTEFSITSDEAISEALMRSASMLCPCLSETLIRHVSSPLQYLSSDEGFIVQRVGEVLNSLISVGSILELPEVGIDTSLEPAMLLYLQSKSFVIRASGTVFLIGVSLLELASLSEELRKQTQVKKYLRYLNSRENANIVATLEEIGFVEISCESWLEAPESTTKEELLNRFDTLLGTASYSGQIDELNILNPDTSVKYYRGRWEKAKSQSGRFIARRPQSYGSPLWCYVELVDGEPQKFIDFPLPNSKWRGCDEAWHLQMAIDSDRGNPQQIEVEFEDTPTTAVIKFFSPVPMWARRRWEALGEPLDSKGCLFAYRFNRSELYEEIQFASEQLWLSEITKEELQ